MRRKLIRSLSSIHGKSTTVPRCKAQSRTTLTIAAPAASQLSVIMAKSAIFCLRAIFRLLMRGIIMTTNQQSVMIFPKLLIQNAGIGLWHVFDVIVTSQYPLMGWHAKISKATTGIVYRQMKPIVAKTR